MLDSEDECPARLAPKVIEAARQARADLPAGVVLPKYEFEAWFLAAAESLRGCRGLEQDLEAPEDPESIRGAKEWLRRHTQRGEYSETIDQPALTALFDLGLARRRSPSFDKCYREIERLLTSIAAGQA